jgi:hypothetical protein
MKRKRKMTGGIRLPRRVIDLGRCVEIHFSDGRTWSTGKRRIHLCSSESGKTLWVLPVSQEKKTRIPQSKLYEDYTGYYVSGIRTAFGGREKLPKRLINLGKVKAVVYESSKWDGKKREYIHTFRKFPVAKTDNADKPLLLKISGGRIRVKPEGITG